ncbi:EamA family transporter RarD [Desulfovibrio sp. OttesenSCG-928-C06]|nr:EamA family transporter RarD [Desulfovibrio sp. OttesenSCG-928-C06]
MPDKNQQASTGTPQTSNSTELPETIAEQGYVKNPALGLLAILCCNVIWGFLPFYWRSLQSVPSYQIVCQRIVWSCLTLGIICLITRKFGYIRKIFSHPRELLTLVASSLMISVNWLIYINMVNTGQVLMASLSTYISPLFTVAMGMLVLKERPSKAQRVAIPLALGGVLVQVWITGSLPVGALLMATFHAIYGLLRARLNVEVVAGLFIENLVAVPIVGAFLISWHMSGELVFAQGNFSLDLLLAGTGLITAFPLMMLVYAMRNAKMSTVGLMQFVSPSIIFIVGIFAFNEEFTTKHFASFLLIWAGLAIYCTDSLRSFNRHGRSGTGTSTTKSGKHN